MADTVKAIVVVVVIVIALFFGFCCHFASQKRREEEQNAEAVQGRGTSGNTTNRNNASTVYIIGLQGQGATSNSNARAPNENPLADESPQSPDPIADSGPPPYSCLTTSSGPLPLPPSYEEALSASTENLAATRQQHIV